MTEQDAAKGLVTPFMRGLRLLRYIAEGGATGNLSEVGRLIDVNRVTVMRLLATLEHEGLIERLPQGGHRVGTAFMTLAASALSSFDLLAEGRNAIEQLSRELKVSAYMVVLEGYQAVYVHRAMPEGGLVSHIRVGSRVSAFLTAPGRILLSQLSSAQVQELWQQWQESQPQEFASASLEFTHVMQQLQEDAQRGHVWSFSGYEQGINACAAGIKWRDDRHAAALSVVAAQPLFDADASLAGRMQESVQSAARQLSRVAGF